MIYKMNKIYKINSEQDGCLRLTRLLHLAYPVYLKNHVQTTIKKLAQGREISGLAAYE